MVVNTHDFHTHSNASDGTLPPSELIERAIQAGVKCLAITDHDSISGYLSISNKSLPNDFKLISGVELTCLSGKQMVHVVGLGFDSQNGDLAEHLLDLQRLRLERARQIAERLVKQGLPDLLEDALACAEGQVGRPHFAQVMVAKGLVADAQQAFKKYLGSGKAGDVKVEWPSMERVVQLINKAGGVSVLAHPTKYNLTLNKIRYLVAAFAEVGGQAIEMSYPAVTPDQQRSLSFLVQKHDLLISMGSDFHDPEQHWTDVGRYPEISYDLPSVKQIIDTDNM